MYDIIIIGAGTAGIAAYQEAIKHTQNILIINDGPWDTTCARVGCMPSKVLISAAERMHDIQHAEQVALQVTSQIDTSQVMSHVRTLRDRFTAGTLKSVGKWPAEHKISGKAHFIDAQIVEVEGQRYQAKHFILAVGSTPALQPQWQQVLAERLINSDQIFELPELPRALAVIGSGVIALELAQAMQRLGVETSIFARSNKAGILSSPTLQTLSQQLLSQELNILFETLPDSMQRHNDEVEITYTHQGKAKKIRVDYVLNATGRQSLLTSLKLENIDPAFNEIKSLPIDAQSKQLGDYPIFIVGDAFSQTPVQHEAAHEGKQAVHNCLSYPQTQPIKTLTPLAIVFSSPQMAIAGKSYQQLESEQHKFVTGQSSYEKQGRALVLGKNQGAIEVYVDVQTGQLLGAELFLTECEHLAHLLAWMIDEQLTVDAILQKPFYHPTLEEGLRTALKHARRQLTSL